jgi:2-iminobutanoate/2-iminopropanoate deaminase
MEAITSAPGVPKPVGAYSCAVKAGGFLFCAGQIPLDPEKGVLVGEDIETQTRQVLKNVGALLKECGSGWDRVVMTTTFLSDIAHGKTVNELYSQVINRDCAPARQTVAVKALPMGALVEISVIAALG